MPITITPAEAARLLGVSPTRVRAMITAGRLPAAKFGSSWIIKRSDLRLVAERKVGRPKNGKK